MSFEDRLRDAMRARAERAEASPDAHARIVERIDRRPRPTWLAPALATGGVIAVVALAGALVAGDGDDDDGPAPRAVPVADVQPIWPVTDPTALAGMQRRVDSGDEAWLLDAEQVARRYLEEHGMSVDVRPVRPEDREAVGDALASYPDAIGVGYRGGWVNLARAERDDAAAWFVVSAYDSRIPIVDATRRGARVDIEFSVIVDDVVVTARAGSLDRDWLAETTVDLERGRSRRLVLDVGSDPPAVLLVQVRTTDTGAFVGLTEMPVEDEFSRSR